MTIAIIAAMEQECEILRSHIEHCQTQKIGTSTIYSGEIAGKKVALLQSGIGKVAAATGTTSLINAINPKVIINTGSAGGLDTNLKIGDIVVSKEVAHHDADVTAFGYEIGQLPANPARFLANDDLINIAMQAVKKMNKNAVLGLVLSGDQFINSSAKINKIRTAFNDVSACEMEAAAVAQVCHSFEVPFVIVRAISDVADCESHISFDEFLPLAAKESSQIVLKMIDKL